MRPGSEVLAAFGASAGTEAVARASQPVTDLVLDGLALR
jgi:hypothetical protein